MELWDSNPAVSSILNIIKPLNTYPIWLFHKKIDIDRDHSRGGKIYTEKKTPWFYWILVLCVVISLGYSTWWGWRTSQYGWDEDLLITTIIFTGILIPLFLVLSWVFRGYFIRVDEEGIHIGYSSWNVRLDHSQIIDAKKVKIRWIEWGVMGWRIKGTSNIGYILSSGPGIEISTKIKDRSYTFNCEDPETILAELKNNGVKIRKDHIE